MQVLNFKTGIKFGATGNLKEFSPIGFSANADDVSTWSESSVAELLFRLPPLRHDIRFTIEVFPFLVNNLLTQQNCWIFFNGLFVHYQTVKTSVEMIFTVSRDLLNPRVNRLSFALPNATAPKELNIGNDLRLLGLSFVKLTAGPASAPALERRDAEPAERTGTFQPRAAGLAGALNLARPADRSDAASQRPGGQRPLNPPAPASRGHAAPQNPATQSGNADRAGLTQPERPGPKRPLF